MNSISISMVNGEITDTICIHDRGLAFGDGVFETMRFENSQLPFLQLHLQRLSTGCEYLGISLDQKKLQNSLKRFQFHLTQLGYHSGVMKIVVTRGAGGRGVVPPGVDYQTPNVILSFRYDGKNFAGWLQNPCELVLSNYVLPCNPNLAGIKHLNRLDYVMAAHRQPSDEGQQLVLMDSERYVIETLHHNIFCSLNNELVTPLLDSAGVKGVIRRLIIEELAPQLGINVAVRAISVEELCDAKEIFITNAVAGVIPINKLDGRDLSTRSMSKNIGTLLQKRASFYAS